MQLGFPFWLNIEVKRKATNKIFNVIYVLRCACTELKCVASIRSVASICVYNFVSLFNTFLLLCVPVATELVCST
jgi:hypothetical protein